MEIVAWFLSPCIARKNDVKQLGGQAVSNRPALSETFFTITTGRIEAISISNRARRLFAFYLDMINYKSLKDFARYIIKDFFFFLRFFPCYIRCKLLDYSLSLSLSLFPP